MYVGRESLEMGLYDAVAYFNIGSSAVLKLFDALGKYCKYCNIDIFKRIL